jgi:gluconolactonase
MFVGRGKAMHSYAQTNLQLFNQLRAGGYSKADLGLVRDAYELAMALFSGRFQPSGKSFIGHVVGTASILGSLRLSAAVVAAGLLHNVYENGDFSDGRKGISQARRRRIRKSLGSEAETYIAKFPALYWDSKTIKIARYDPDNLDATDRVVLLILFAEHLEHLLDLDVLYYDDRVGRFFIEHGKIAAEIAQALDVVRLAVELKKAVREAESSAALALSPAHRVRNDSFIFVALSCRKRFFAAGRNRADYLRRNVSRWAKFLRQKSPDSLKRALRYLSLRPAPADGLEIKSAAFPHLFPEGATPERVATGFQFTEGPVWIEEDRSLLFSDIPENQILKLSPEGRISVFRAPSGKSNGLTRDGQGRLIACEHGNRRLSRSEYDGTIVPIAETFGGYKLNSPNDVVVSSDGAIYFTDPPYGIEIYQQEQPIQGVYRISPDGKEISLVAEDFALPNGLAFAPDESKLYINDSVRRHIRVFDVQETGSLSGGSIFHDLNADIPGSPDGMKVDVDGRLYCTAAGGVWVFDPTGRHLGTIVTPEKPSNCAWGDEDWCSLYITAVTSVYRIRVNTPGIKVPAMPSGVLS